MNNKYKKIIRRLTVFICIAAILLVFIINNLGKNKIVRMVNINQKFLNQCVENKAYDKIYKIRGIKRIQKYPLDNDGLYIDFYCYGFGLVPSSIYYGFYYVSNDKPSGFQATNVKLEPDGKGWKWKETNGDNWYYTEKISDNWYFYKAGF